jgi:hypothetical protein
MGKRTRAPSTLRQSPAPREIHTEYFNVLSAASFVLDACKYLELVRKAFFVIMGYTNHPRAKMPIWLPQKMK